jgi:hypothetical protein
VYNAHKFKTRGLPLTLQRKIEHAAKAAKWKVDQQLRINRAAGAVEDTKNQIFRAKIALADVVLEAYLAGKLGEMGAIETSSKELSNLTQQLTAKQQELESIKQEHFPEFVAADLVEQAARGANVSEPGNEKICANCGASVPVKFCPNCGQEYTSA